MKYSILLISCLSGLTCFGQSKKFTFKLGSEYSLKKKSSDLAFLGNDKDGIVNLSMKKDDLNILRFDPKTLNQTGDNVIEEKETKKSFTREVVIAMGTNYYWLHSDWDKAEQKEYLYYDKIDVVNGTIAAADKKMLEATEIAPIEVHYSLYTSKMLKYQFNGDAESKKLLVSYRLVPEKKRDKDNYDKIGLNVFDENLNIIWKNEFTMPYTEAIMDNTGFSVDGFGNAYMLAKVYDSEKRKEKDKETGAPAYHYEVLKFTKDSKEVIHNSIAIGENFIRSASLVESSSHEMLITCTYSKKSKGTGTDGVFLAVLDQTGKISKYKDGYYQFPLEELEKFESAKTKRKIERKDDYEAPNLTVRDIVIEKDGSVLFTCEEYYVISSKVSTGNGSSYISNTHYYEDIIAAKINANGSFAWVRKIPKKQKGFVNGGTMSFKLVNDTSGYYFLFLDNKKNLELADDEVAKYHVDGFGGQVVVCKIDNAGLMSKEVVFDTREEEMMILPKLFTRINSNQFIGRAVLKKGDFKPILITVN